MAGFCSSTILHLIEGKQLSLFFNHVYKKVCFHEKKCSVEFNLQHICCSLMNYSNEIRWSVDLRWQSPKHHWGFYDIGEGVLFRSAEKEIKEPDWEKFFSVDRKEIWQKKYFAQVMELFGHDVCLSLVRYN